MQLSMTNVFLACRNDTEEVLKLCLASPDVLQGGPSGVSPSGSCGGDCALELPLSQRVQPIDGCSLRRQWPCHQGEQAFPVHGDSKHVVTAWGAADNNRCWGAGL